MMPECRLLASHVHIAEKAHNTTLNDETYKVHRDGEYPIVKHMTEGTQETHVMTVLCVTSPKLSLWTLVTTSLLTCDSYHLNVKN